jgi:hypothetical protein
MVVTLKFFLLTLAPFWTKIKKNDVTCNTPPAPYGIGLSITPLYYFSPALMRSSTSVRMKIKYQFFN